MGATTRILTKSGFFRKHEPASPLPISVDEFFRIWTRIWPKSRDHPGLAKPKTNTIGLAISGGVDSMALAFLCSSIKNRLSQANGGTDFRAFVVDHNVREGSHQEAEAVCNSLVKRGIQSHILQMQWTKFQGSISSNFESAARTYRFRTLGKACREWGIESLLLAHHQDDQVETIMMRLMEGHRTGLTGIRESSEIPECYGIHGVHESGGLDRLDLAGVVRDETDVTQTREENPQVFTETGGVRLYRPLLGFSKERLIATCRQNNVEWFEDHTNADQTLTKRNAIRFMRANHELPKALSSSSLLNLCQRMKEQKQLQQKVLRQWLSKCNITALDLQAGTMQVRFTDLNEFKSDSSWPGDKAGQIAAEYLRKVIMLVTPQEHISLDSLHSTVGRIFPELTGGEPQGGSFTVCGLYFQLMPPDAAKKSFIPSKTESKAGSEHQLKPTWHISRQPFLKQEITRQTLTFSLPPSNQSPPISAPPLTPSPDTTSPIPPSQTTWSPFQLWDGRYWIRLRLNPKSTHPLHPLQPTSTSRSIVIKPLSPAHWTRLKARLSREQPNVLKSIKARSAGSVKWTLPALVVRDRHGMERAVALPSLCVVLERGMEEIECQVRYKKIYTEGLEIPGL